MSTAEAAEPRRKVPRRFPERQKIRIETMKTEIYKLTLGTPEKFVPSRFAPPRRFR